MLGMFLAGLFTGLALAWWFISAPIPKEKIDEKSANIAAWVKEKLTKKE